MRNKHLWLIVSLCMLLCASLLVMGAAAYDDTKAFTEISTADQLISLMKQEDGWSWDGNYKLTASFTLPTDGQAPIGNATTAFTGIFDGNGKTVSGVNISGSAQGVGFFGVIMDAQIKGLTVEGTVTSTANFCGGMIGVITGNATVENCTSNIAVTAVSRAGGLIGGVALNNALSGYPQLGTSDTATVEITNCKNKGIVSATSSRVAGIVGACSISKTVSRTVTIKGCSNESAITSSSGAATGGIVGYADFGSGVNYLNVIDCKNSGKITATLEAAGIFGYVNNSKSAAVQISGCLNTGDAESTTKNTKNYSEAAGIVGLLANGSVKDCMNAGTVTGVGNAVGGIVGRAATKASVTGCYSSKEATTGAGYTASAIVGLDVITGGGTYENNYYSAGTDTEAHGTSATVVSGDLEANKTAFANLTGDAWTITTNGPELFHTHNYEDGVCTTCGATEGSHTHTTDGVWHLNESNEYYYSCITDGEVMHTQTEAPVVYLDAGTIKSATVGSDDYDGLTEDTAVLTIEEAVTRIAETGGKIMIIDRYTIGANVTLPTYSKEITITSPGSTGFLNTKTGALLSLGGPTKFENIVFNNVNAVKDSEGNTTYVDRILVFEGNWNDVTFGEKLATYGSAYYVAGYQNPTENDTDAKTVTLNFSKTTANAGGLAKPVTFFNRIMLGDRFTSATSATTVFNKTVTANFHNTTVGSLWAGTTSDASANVQMVNCNTTLNVYEAAYIAHLKSGDGNTNDAAGTAYMDSLTVNLLENSRIWSSFKPSNVRKMTLNISGPADGRDYAAYPIAIQFGDIGLTEAYLASESYTGTETLAMNYTSHSFKNGVAAPTYASQYAVTATVTDECTYDDGVVTTEPTLTTPGVKTYTCTTCGATKTEEIATLKAVLTQKSVTAATYEDGLSTVRFITNLDLAEGVAVTKIGTYISLSAFNADGTASTKVAKVEKEITDGTAPASFAVDLTEIPDTAKATAIYAWSYADLASGERVVFAFNSVAVDGLMN